METRRTVYNRKDLNRGFDVRCDATNTMVRQGVGGREGAVGDQSDEKQWTKLSEPGSKVIS